ncbi:hypothetical protein AA16373_2140 [Komagataeibacter swingsii DSM 16373]|nr:hypothetical protein AA16373_2140 [Komagataeibacter swingsii DSM 16373]
MPLLAPRQPLRRGKELLLHAQQGTRLVQQHQPHIRQPDPARQPLEQKDTQFIFQLLDLLAKRWLFYA